MEPIIVVSGLPRSGTSMMMRMLGAAGIPLLHDDIRSKDEDNPGGYFEFEPIKQTREDHGWVERAHGHAVKVVSPLLEALPATHRYRVVLMKRHLSEILLSQEAMMVRRGESDDVSAQQLLDVYARHMAHIKLWLRRARHIEAVEVDYNALLAGSTNGLREVADLLERPMDVPAMADIIDADLYRQRSA